MILVALPDEIPVDEMNVGPHVIRSRALER
jgi:hypothetical protein